MCEIVCEGKTLSAGYAKHTILIFENVFYLEKRLRSTYIMKLVKHRESQFVFQKPSLHFCIFASGFTYMEAQWDHY